MAKPVLFLAFLALLLASLGPVLDHHFAERQPAHGHLYLGAQASDHQHPYQQVHVHVHEPVAAGHPPISPSPRPEDTVYLTNFQSIGQMVSTLASPCRYIPLAFPDGEDRPLLQAEPAPDAWSAAAVTPLERPPLA